MDAQKELAATSASWVSRGQILFSLLTTVLTFYISVQQQTIKEKQDDLAVKQLEMRQKQDGLTLVVATKAETEKWAERTLSYVEKLTGLNPHQKEAIVIDLLDAIALANTSREGTTDQQKILHTPLWIALATGNVEALGLIGNADSRRDVWCKLANGSGDPTVRRTAMEALASSSASTPMDHLVRIYELSEHLNNAAILDTALEQIGRVVRVMERNSDPARFREDDHAAPIIARLELLRTNIAVTTASPFAEGAGASADPSKLQKQARDIEYALAFLRGSEPSSAVPPPSSAGQTAVPPRADVTSLVAGLKSADTDTRRKSRLALAELEDPETTQQLLAELLTDRDNYRIRLGVASALYQAKRPVVIRDAAHVKVVVGLLGDEDLLIRKYSSEALMKLTDDETLNRARQELLATVHNRASAAPNAVYNAVVVLGTWLRILPVSLESEKRTLNADLVGLKAELQREPQWRNTSALIDELLRLSSSGRRSSTASPAMNFPRARG